jgi:predicted MFS family arabinose efflux permease
VTSESLTTREAIAPRSEWAANWPLLLSAIIGIPASMYVIYALGQFLGPLEQEFGWSRSEASAGLSLSLLLGFLATPLVGRLVDSTNARLLALPGLILVGLGIAGFSLANESPGLWIALWCFYSLVATLAGPTVWIAVISSAFKQNRSFAISLALCGTSLASMFAPASARYMIDAYGWRTAFQLLGLLWVSPALLCAVFFFFDRRELAPASAQHQDAPVVRPAMRGIFLSATFIKLALAIFASMIAFAAYMIHLAPALADKGLSPTLAATTAGVAGLAAIFGKLGLGSIFDRAGPSAVSLIIMMLLALCSVLLALDSTNVIIALAGCALLGIAAGGMNVAIACITARLFAASVFGVVYGTLTSLTALGGAVGPYLASMIHDGTGSYAMAFWGGLGIAAVSALLLSKLDPVAS